METLNAQSSGELKDVNLIEEKSSTAIEDSEHKTTQTKTWNFWTVFSSTFLTIFLAEMGDKTQLVTLLMSAESQSPWLVFAGAAAALISTSLLGVAIGYWLSKKLSPKTLNLAVAVLLLFITGWLLGDVIS
jgi:putative Ca2+/H+ antiporter (TMEM165/GDT1 family)